MPQVGQHHFTARAVAVQCDVQVLGPGQRVAHLRAAQGAQIVQIVGGVLGQVQRAFAREEEVHLRRRLGLGRELEFDLDAVDHLAVEATHHGIRHQR